MEERFTIRPPSASRSAASLLTLNTPVRLVSMTACHSSLVIFLTLRSRRMAALLTTMWRPPNRAAAASNMAASAAGSRTSASIAAADGPIAAAVCSARCRFGPAGSSK